MEIVIIAEPRDSRRSRLRARWGKADSDRVKVPNNCSDWYDEKKRQENCQHSHHAGDDKTIHRENLEDKNRVDEPLSCHLALPDPKKGLALISDLNFGFPL